GAVSGTGNADSAFSSSKGLVASQECKALGLVTEQHSAQVTVAQTHVSLLGNGAGHAEGLQADTDGLSSLGSGLNALLDSNSAAQGISPACVLKCDGLYALYDLIRIKALAQAKLAG